jgi:hypothetical protein
MMDSQTGTFHILNNNPDTPPSFCTPPPQKKWAALPLHAAIFTLPSSHSPWAMKRNVEREKEEVLVRLIYKKT